ncbi:MAG: hypothetical protein DMG13_14725 [Acidobacteria bacterium]|nr:MAG: hypothetical protein DMG13_14725 [Acidobacteriota bacterium]
MKNTLIIRACAIGDFVLNLPALQALRKARPDQQLTLVGYPSTLELAREFIPVEGIYSIESPPWSRLFHQPVSGLEFDSAIVWMKDPVFAGNLRRSGIHDVVSADPFPPHGHAAMHLLRTLKLGTPPLPDFWTPGSNDIIIHPGSGSPKKNWPYFDQLAGRLSNVVKLFGPDDKADSRAGILPLAQVSHLLRHCRGYVGNDSGITHLAAYLGCPTIAIFGPTDPRIWGPIGRRSRVIWKTKLEDISVEELLLALRRSP